MEGQLGRFGDVRGCDVAEMDHRAQRHGEKEECARNPEAGPPTPDQRPDDRQSQGDVADADRALAHRCNLVADPREALGRKSVCSRLGTRKSITLALRM